MKIHSRWAAAVLVGVALTMSIAPSGHAASIGSPSGGETVCTSADLAIDQYSCNTPALFEVTSTVVPGSVSAPPVGGAPLTPGPIPATAAVATTSDPTLTANASNYRFTSQSNGPTFGEAWLNFPVEVAGPALGPGLGVPVVMSGNVQVSLNPAGGGYATYGFSLGGGGALLPGILPCPGVPLGPNGCLGQIINQAFYILPNQVSTASYWVYVLANGSAVAPGVIQNQIILDPVLQIDPTWAAVHPGYTLTLADGVGNTSPVPVPGSFVLLASGLGLAGAAAYCRRSRVSVANAL